MLSIYRPSCIKTILSHNNFQQNRINIIINKSIIEKICFYWVCPYSYLNKRNGGGGGKKIRYMLFKIVILLMLKVKKKTIWWNPFIDRKIKRTCALPLRDAYNILRDVFLIYVAINMIDLIQCKRVHVEQNFNRVSLV